MCSDAAGRLLWSSQRDTTFLCKLCPVFHSLMLTAVLYSMDTCSLQLSTSGGNGRGNVMFLSTSSQCWRQTAPKVWLAQKRQKICSDLHQPALPIVSLKETPRVTDTTTCEHKPYLFYCFLSSNSRDYTTSSGFIQFWILLCPLLSLCSWWMLWVLLYCSLLWAILYCAISPL